MTLEQVKALTEADIEAARRDPDFFPDEEAQSIALCERILAISPSISPETAAYLEEMKQRRWITPAAWKRALKDARRDFESWRDGMQRAR